MDQYLGPSPPGPFKKSPQVLLIQDGTVDHTVPGTMNTPGLDKMSVPVHLTMYSSLLRK